MLSAALSTGPVAVAAATAAKSSLPAAAAAVAAAAATAVEPKLVPPSTPGPRAPGVRLAEIPASDACKFQALDAPSGNCGRPGGGSKARHSFFGCTDAWGATGTEHGVAATAAIEESSCGGKQSGGLANSDWLAPHDHLPRVEVGPAQKGHVAHGTHSSSSSSSRQLPICLEVKSLRQKVKIGG